MLYLMSPVFRYTLLNSNHCLHNSRFIGRYRPDLFYYRTYQELFIVGFAASRKRHLLSYATRRKHRRVSRANLNRRWLDWWPRTSLLSERCTVNDKLRIHIICLYKCIYVESENDEIIIFSFNINPSSCPMLRVLVSFKLNLSYKMATYQSARNWQTRMQSP